MTHEEIFALAPDYGSGIARRRIRLDGQPGQVLVEMEDIAHGMRCLIEHDGARVTAITPEFLRIPLTTCSGSRDPLQQVVGIAVGCDYRSFFADGRARRNCTHMLDLAWLGVMHALRGLAVRDYEIVVPDPTDGRATATLYRDGELVLEWLVENLIIQQPLDMAGLHLFRGFSYWALANTEGDRQEALIVLQRGCFVAQARRFAIEPGSLTAGEQKLNGGLCYGFGLERIGTAERLGGTKRDFTHHPERLLKFL